jgi:hypothetical protein
MCVNRERNLTCGALGAIVTRVAEGGEVSVKESSSDFKYLPTRMRREQSVRRYKDCTAPSDVPPELPH